MTWRAPVHHAMDDVAGVRSSAPRHVRHPGADERLLQGPRLDVRAVQHGDLRQRHAAGRPLLRLALAAQVEFESKS